MAAADQGEIPEVMGEIKEAMEKSPAHGAAKIEEYLNKKINIPLNIAVTGESGSGKSTFVNAFRGVDNRDEDAAPTGCVETTIEVTSYPHPKFPNVTLWDLPGIGTTRFPAAEYLEHVGFERFDFFIIISSDRFRENDANLAHEIQKQKKKFYFVRSKIDDNIRSAERSQRNFNQEKTLKEIRENCLQNLEEQGVQSPQVFLVSSFELHLYDFHLLEQTLERELPEHKRHVLLLVMPNISLDIIKKKKKALQGEIKYYASLSAAAAFAPIPGLSVAADTAILVKAAMRFQFAFGLDPESLKNLAQTTNVSVADLKAVMKSPLAAQKITKDLIVRVISSCAVYASLMAAEEGFRFIPLLGIPVAMALSFGTTYRFLNDIFNTLADDAQRVFERALGLNTAV